MSKYFLSFSVLILIWVVSGCGDVGINNLQEGTGFRTESQSGTPLHLWGLYEISIDTKTRSVSIQPQRHGMFTCNVVTFLNSNPASLKININNIEDYPERVDLDLDISLTHPFPGMTKFNGYDVRGVFMGDGSKSMKYNPKLIYPVFGTDQYMLNDPMDGFGGPDGYTRWFNAPEFSLGGMPLFKYTHGKYATPGYVGTATLCPYKYFADDLGATTDLWQWLNNNPSKRGVFSSGKTNTRNYFLSFPAGKNIKYGYAVIASWIAPDAHPANAIEAVGCKINWKGNLWYLDPVQNGGNFKADISIFDWYGKGSENYQLYIESTVLSATHKFTISEMQPIGGTSTYSTYHIDIPADNIKGLKNNEFWLAVEYYDYNYMNEYGTPNNAGNEPLAAFFRFPVPVSNEPPVVNQDPICDLVVITNMPAQGPLKVDVEFSAAGCSDPDGQPLQYFWDFDGDKIYGENPDDSYSGTPVNPIHSYLADYKGYVWLKVEDGFGGMDECSALVDVKVLQKDVIFYWTGDWGTSDPMVIPPMPLNTWSYVGGAYKVLDENGNPLSMATICMGTTWVHTPNLQIPADGSNPYNLMLRIKHWGGANPPWLFEPNPNGFDSGGFIGWKLAALENWNLNSDITPWLTFVSGKNFNSVNPMNLAIGGSGSWCPYLGVGWGPNVWNNRAFGAISGQNLWGSMANPWESIFKIDDALKGKVVHIGFYWGGLEEDMGKASYPGWCIREIEIYKAPK